MGLAFIVLSLSGYAVILPGTTVCGVNLGCMTVSRAGATLEESLQWTERKILLAGDGFGVEALLGADLGVTPDYLATARGCRRPVWRFLVREYPLLLKVEEPRFTSFAIRLSALFDRDARDARFGFGPDGRVVVFPEQVGRTLDLAAFGGPFSGEVRFYGIPRSIALPFVKAVPGILSGDLEEYLPLERVAAFTTYYAEATDRASNIALACVSLSEMTIGPGETFSFNRAVGPRTAERGYRKAPTFVGEETVDDYGGGVCQVSTTLYVLLLKAGFGVGERYCHSKPVEYVPMGLDATVVYDYLDLKMTNTTGGPCLLQVTAIGGQLTAEVFGRPSKDLKIEVESRVVKEFIPMDPSVGGGEGGEKPRSGFLVETVRRYVRDGRIERVEILDTSMYPPEKPKTR